MSTITTRSTVAALIPHFACEQWLGACIESLLEQTHALDAIIVIDDASENPPVDIVSRYHNVSLLRAERNVGPYRLIQQAIEDFAFDAYLFQDADDWSAPHRLELLLTEAERTGAELVGSYELRVYDDEHFVKRITYPRDVNAALCEHPQGFPLLHPTSLVARSLVERLGGFASGMRFSGDAEFLRRAGHVARIVNVPAYLYFRRKREGALTTSSDTGLGAPARELVQRQLRARALDNARRVAAGLRPDIRPFSIAESVRLEPVCGPHPSKSFHTPVGPVTHASESGPPRTAKPPIFLVGPSDRALELVAWSLAQCGSITPALDARWMSDLMRGCIAALAGEFHNGLEARRVASLGRVGSLMNDLLAAASPRGGGDEQFVIAYSALVDDLPALSVAMPASRFIFVDATSDDSVDAKRQACERAQRALGPERMIPVDLDELLSTSESTMRMLFAFIGLPYDARCLRVLGSAESQEAATPGTSKRSPSTEIDRAVWWSEYLEAIERQSTLPASIERMRHAAMRVVPEGATVAVISRGDDRLLELDSRRAVHFPANLRGEYLGYHPATGEEARELLRSAMAEGVEYIVIPSTSLWWLDHYGAMRKELDRAHRLVLLDPDVAAIYARGDARTPPANNAHRRSARDSVRNDTHPLDELARLRATGDARCMWIAQTVCEVADDVASMEELEWIDRIEEMRRTLCESDEQISIALPSIRRVEKYDTIGNICRLRSKQDVWGRVLMKLVGHARPTYAIELGTCMGVSSAYQAAGLALNGTGTLTTLEGAPALAELAAGNLEKLVGERARVVPGLFVETLPTVLNSIPHIDFAFVDGHHDETATQRYFELMLSNASAGSLFVFDDIRWSVGMRNAWVALCTHPAVTTAVDLGVIGVCVVNGEHRQGVFEIGPPSALASPDRSFGARQAPTLPSRAHVLVITRGDDALLALGGAQAEHFPGDDCGWSGFHPVDSQEALGMLERRIRNGATHLLIPRESFWWLEFYGEFAAKLGHQHELVERTGEYALFQLNSDASLARKREAIEEGSE